MEKVLRGLTIADDRERRNYEDELERLRNLDGFVQALVELAQNNTVDRNIRVTAVACLNDNVKNFYAEERGQIIGSQDKIYLRSNIIDLMTYNMNDNAIRKTYQEILAKMIVVDYPLNWAGFLDDIILRMKAAEQPEQLFGSLYSIKALVRKYQLEVDDERQPLELILSLILPFLENLIITQMRKGGKESVLICKIVLSIVSMAVRMQIPECIKGASLCSWMITIKLALDHPLSQPLSDKISDWEQICKREEETEVRIKIFAMKIASRFALHCTNSRFDNCAWVGEYINNYALGFFESAFMAVKNYHTQFVSPKVVSSALKTIVHTLEIDDLYNKAACYLETLVLDYIVPLFAFTPKDEELWNQEPVQYIYSEKNPSDDHNTVKNCAAESLVVIAELEAPDGERLIYKLINFIGYCLNKGINPRTGKNIDPIAFEYLFRAVESVGEVIQHDKILVDKLPFFFENFVMPSLNYDNPYLRSRACSVYATLGGIVTFNDSLSYQKACQGITSCMNYKALPVRVSGCEALTVLLYNQEAREMLKSDLQNILNIIFELMTLIDSDDLIEALEGIVKQFSDSIGPYTVGLVEGLSQAYFTYKGGSSNSDEVIVDELMGSESTRAAEACLDTIHNLLKINIDDTVYQRVAPSILGIFNSAILDCNDVSFSKCIGLLNMIIYKSQRLNKELMFYFPLLCYLIIGKPKTQLKEDISNFPEELQRVIAEVNTQREWFENLNIVVACFLNYMQKMGPDFLNQNDLYGTPYIDLVFSVVQRIGSNILNLKNREFENLNHSLRILIGIMENFRGKVNHYLPLILEIVQSLLKESQGAETLKSMVLQVIAIMLWYDPVFTAEMLISQNYFNELLEVWFGGISHFRSEFEKERELYGIAALLSLPQNLFPPKLGLSAVMNEVVNVSRQILEFRKRGGKSPEAELDPETAEKNQMSNDDDEDDDEEEVGSTLILV